MCLSVHSPSTPQHTHFLMGQVSQSCTRLPPYVRVKTHIVTFLTNCLCHSYPYPHSYSYPPLRHSATLTHLHIPPPFTRSCTISLILQTQGTTNTLPPTTPTLPTGRLPQQILRGRFPRQFCWFMRTHFRSHAHQPPAPSRRPPPCQFVLPPGKWLGWIWTQLPHQAM